MNVKILSSKGRALVEALSEPADEEGYQAVDVEEDGDTVVLTFTRDPSFAEGESDEEDDDR